MMRLRRHQTHQPGKPSSGLPAGLCTPVIACTVCGDMQHAYAQCVPYGTVKPSHPAMSWGFGVTLCRGWPRWCCHAGVTSPSPMHPTSSPINTTHSSVNQCLPSSDCRQIANTARPPMRKNCCSCHRSIKTAHGGGCNAARFVECAAARQTRLAHDRL